jgi:alkanesulfonate monooxygenase SsuD/methylene tetrahydromethanopterin reductase-like flavin-dependent oxidoreductase (luciferase family)
MDMSLPLTEREPAPDVTRIDSHPGYNRVFREGQLTVGLILPLETHPQSPQPTMRDHIAMAQKAEEIGVAALWARDIPFFDLAYGDVGQIFDPLIYIAHLAAVTRNITLGTAGIVLPLREPLLLAKQINSLDQLTDGRLVVGMSSGDRPPEYPIFGIDFDTRGERFRDAFGVYRKVVAAFQRAFYVDGADTTDGAVLAEVGAAALKAAGFDVDARAFLAVWASDEAIQATHMDFEQTRRFGVSGFPSVFVELDGKIGQIGAGYATAANIQQSLKRLAA